MGASYPKTCTNSSRFEGHKVFMNVLDWFASWSMWLSWALWLIAVEGDEKGIALSAAIISSGVAPVLVLIGASIEPGDSFMRFGSRQRSYCWARLQTFQKCYILWIFDKTNNHQIIIWYINIFQWVVSVSPLLKCFILPCSIIMLIILIRIMFHIRSLLATFCAVSIHTIKILILLLEFICRFDLVVL